MIETLPISTQQAGVQQIPDKALKSAGISARRIVYLRDLADKVLTGNLDFHDLPHLSDEEVVATLTQVKGIGRRPAEICLLTFSKEPATP